MSVKDELLRTGAAAKQAGVSSQSLQYYLMLGLIKATEVTPTGRRLFDKKAPEICPGAFFILPPVISDIPGTGFSEYQVVQVSILQTWI